MVARARGAGRGGAEEAAAAAEEAELAAALEESVRVDGEARYTAGEQAPVPEAGEAGVASEAAPSPSGPQPPPAAVSLADAGFDTGRPAVPESTLGGETTCIVCFSNPKSHVAGPCGHLCACGPCSARMESCPICRAPVLMWMQLRVA